MDAVTNKRAFVSLHHRQQIWCFLLKNYTFIKWVLQVWMENLCRFPFSLKLDDLNPSTLSKANWSKRSAAPAINVPSLCLSSFFIAFSPIFDFFYPSYSPCVLSRAHWSLWFLDKENRVQAVTASRCEAQTNPKTNLALVCFLI